MSIFISYRRETGEFLAGRLYDVLKRDGYEVFYDVESLKNGMFSKQIYEKINESTDFLLILSKNALDRCVDKNDWVRLEIEKALELGKNIVLIFARDFVRPDLKTMPKCIQNVLEYQGLTPTSELFVESIKQLEKRYLLSKPSIHRDLEHSPFILTLNLFHMAIAEAYSNANNVPLTEELKGKFLSNSFSSIEVVEPGYFPYLKTSITNISDYPLVITTQSKTVEACGRFQWSGIDADRIAIGFELDSSKSPIIMPGNTLEYDLCGRNLLMFLESIHMKCLDSIYISVNNKDYYYKIEDFPIFCRYFESSIKKDFVALKIEDQVYRKNYINN